MKPGPWSFGLNGGVAIRTDDKAEYGDYSRATETAEYEFRTVIVAMSDVAKKDIEEQNDYIRRELFPTIKTCPKRSSILVGNTMATKAIMIFVLSLSGVESAVIT